MKKVIILGGKGTAVVIAEQITNAAQVHGLDIEVLGFAFDDPQYASGINGWPVLCGTKEAYNLYGNNQDIYFVFAMYRSDKILERAKLRDSYGIPPEKFLTFIHPSSTVTKSVQLGYGTIVLANCVVNPNVSMGRFCIVMSGACIEHDTKIGDSNFIAAHSCIGSDVHIGNCNFLGLNSSYRTHVHIGDNNIIGMAANVLNDVASNQTMIGNPAKALCK